MYCGNLARGLKRRNVTNTIEKHSKGDLFTELTCDEILAELRRFFTAHTYTRAHTRARASRVERPPRACSSYLSRTRPSTLYQALRHVCCLKCRCPRARALASPVAALELFPHLSCPRALASPARAQELWPHLSVSVLSPIARSYYAAFNTLTVPCTSFTSSQGSNYAWTWHLALKLWLDMLR